MKTAEVTEPGKYRVYTDKPEDGLEVNVFKMFENSPLEIETRTGGTPLTMLRAHYNWDKVAP